MLSIYYGDEVFYIKQTPEALFIEAEIIAFLRSKCTVTCVPEVISQDKELKCFLMKSCGDQSLRNLFSHSFDMALLLKGMSLYKEIQKSTETHIDELLALGVPDWRLPQIPVLYANILKAADLTDRFSLTLEQVDRLLKLEDAIAGACVELANFHIPDCLNHSDLQDNNILVELPARSVSVIDWGEVTIGNPFFSLSKIMATVPVRYNLDRASQLIVENRIFSDFSLTDTDAGHIVSLLKILSPIYYILTLIRLEELTEHTHQAWNKRVGQAFKQLLSLDETKRH